MSITNILFVIFALFILEIILRILVFLLKKNFQWIITKEDEFPKNIFNKLNKFYKTSYSRKLGWDRKINSSGTERLNKKITFFKIDRNGARNSNKFYKNKKVLVLGDSYAFCRHVNDNQAWPHLLQDEINCGVSNYGVGNYGVDQAILKYDIIKKKKKFKLVILAFVPETISRIHSYWKHYSEFGNILGFKPIFKIKNKKLILIKNFLDPNIKFNRLKKKIHLIKKNDIFYEKKFKKHIFGKFYIITYFRFFARYNYIFMNLLIHKLFFFVMNEKSYFFNNAFAKVVEENIEDAYRMYESKTYNNLLKELIINFSTKLKKDNKKLLVLFLPQLYDVKINNYKTFGYKNFISKLKDQVNLIDLREVIKEKGSVNKYYLEDKHGGHFSTKGNKLVSKAIKKKVKDLL
jgi:hypothetical protein